MSEPSPVCVHLRLCLWAWLTCVGVRQGCPPESVENTVLLDRRAWRSCCLRAPEPISFLPSEPPLNPGGQDGCGSQVWSQEKGSETPPHADHCGLVRECVGCSGYRSGHFIGLPMTEVGTLSILILQMGKRAQRLKVNQPTGHPGIRVLEPPH